MKKIALLVLAVSALTAGAQRVDDPAVMTVNGLRVPRSEFEYSYNKNGGNEGAVEEKTVEEYAEMYLNYKLKVIEAEALRLDTASDFRKEFLQYRDMQLTPYMVDEEYIDSVARSLYDRYAEKLQGKDMLRPEHILVLLKQGAPEAEARDAKAKIDSIYAALQAGADFAELAKTLSDDPASAERGGLLPWIGPGTTLKEFEEAAYKLQPGETCPPVQTPVGYHVIRMKERKQLEPFEELRPQIVKSIRQQGVEEASAEARIQKQVAASGGRLDREAVLDSVLAAHLDQPELKYLVQEYHDGLLFYQISKDQVWDPAKNDTVALEEHFKKNKKKYAWTEPRFNGYTIHSRDAKLIKPVQKLIKKNPGAKYKELLKGSFNKDSVVVVVNGPYLSKAGENKVIDHYVFGKPASKPAPKFPFSGVFGKKQAQPKSYKDVRAQVETDVQEQREAAWVESLRAKYPYTIHKEALQTVNNHK
ncbi:MAG: peptidylprolyl isomerase [Alloprevotella sp.]|nr:peptidylprolyl isomerase [Alloprevotella sp.]